VYRQKGGVYTEEKIEERKVIEEVSDDDDDVEEIKRP
jgi:hypothetical protein